MSVTPQLRKKLKTAHPDNFTDEIENISGGNYNNSI